MKDHRQCETRSEKNAKLLICFSLFLFFAVIILAMFLNKDQLIIDILHAAGYVCGGGLTGYGIGIQRAKSFNKKTKTA